ncbi:MAG: homoserine O-acetyltransferase [Saprospiraceae bacterium]|nr:homoserine O-acetyltransferase [Saprospiraceae bacterium]
MMYYKHSEPFHLEAGGSLSGLQVVYCTYGRLNANCDNVVWICHALTANADAADWWDGLVGEGRLIDPERYFIVCANMLGSCYGTTGPDSINPETGEPYGRDFPLVTIRDMVRAHQLLRQHLGIRGIELAIGGSMGGQQVLEWAVAEPGLFRRLCVLATNARHSPWGIAFNEAQRMAIEADTSKSGQKGLEAARAIAMLSYRHYHTYWQSQLEENAAKVDDFRAGAYQRYQGYKLYKRFHIGAYLALSKAMDSHHLGRGRESAAAALGRISAPTLVVGIRSDILFPIEEQAFLARHIPNARLEIIDSIYGHDGFLVEFEAIAALLQKFLEEETFITAGRRKIFETFTVKGERIALPGTETF